MLFVWVHRTMPDDRAIVLRSVRPRLEANIHTHYIAREILARQTRKLKFLLIRLGQGRFVLMDLQL